MKRTAIILAAGLLSACSAVTSAPPAANLATACDTLAAGYMTAAALRSTGKLTSAEVAVLTKLEPTALAACSKTNPPLDTAGALATVVAAAGSIAAITEGK